MKGYAYLGEGKTGWIEKEKPNASGDAVLIRPMLVSPCTSDVHNAEFDYVKPGRILGHEGIGEIVEVGELVKDFKIGDIVAVSPVSPDWNSVMAQKGSPQHFNGPLSGNLISNRVDGLFAEYALIPYAEANIAKVPDDISPEAAVMTTDMMNTGLTGAEMADISFGDTVVVLGIGPVGLMAVAGARLQGAGRIIAIGSRPVCVEAAKRYGATDIINYKEGDIAKQVFTLTEKKGADRVIVAGGDEHALNQAVSMVRYGGTISNINYFTTDKTLDISNIRWGFGMGNKTIRGSLTHGGRARLEALMELIRYGRIDPQPLITHRFEGMDGIPEAFRMMSEKPGDMIKTCVKLG